MGKYLTVDEQSTYIDVACDGYVFRIVTSAWDTNIFIVRNAANDTELIRMAPYWSDGTVYNFGYDSARSTEIIESTPTRVKIRVVGSPSSTNGDTDTYLTNLPSGSVRYEFTFYSDRYTVSTEWKPTGAISYTANGALIVEGLETAFTNEDHFYENSGVESAASTYTVYNSADYLCFTSDEMNAQCTLIDQSGWSFDQRSGGVCDFVYRDTSALAAGTYTGTILVIIDSAQREKTSRHTDVLLTESLSDVDNLATGLTKVGTPTNSEGGLEVTGTSYVSMATAGLLDISKGTIEFEFKSNAAFNDGGLHFLIGSRGTTQDPGDIEICKNASNRLRIEITDSSDGRHYIEFDNTTVIDDDWTSRNHYRFVWDSSAVVDGTNHIALYLNNVLITPSQTTGATSSWTDATLDSIIGIGNDPEDTSRDMDGIMKNLFISDVPHDKKFGYTKGSELWDADAAVFTSGTYSWSEYDNNVISNDNNTLKIAYNDNANGANCYFNNSADLSSDLTVGQTYRFKCQAKVGSGDSVGIAIYDGSGTDSVTIDSTTFVNVQMDFTAQHATNALIRMASMSTGEEIWLDNISLKSITPVERLQLGDQYKDTSMPTAVGHVTDRIIPANIGSYGFCSDGAWHLDASTKNRGRVEPDITRLDPVWLYENWNIRTGDLDSFEDHLVEHWECNDNAASTTIVSRLGNYDGTLNGGDNTEDITQTDAVRGRSLLTNGTDDELDFSTALAGLTTLDQMSVFIKFKPNFAYDTGSNLGLFSINAFANNTLSCAYRSTSDYFEVILGLDGDSTSIAGEAFTSNNDLQQWHTILVSLDLINDVLIYIFDGRAMGVKNISDSFTATPTDFTVGYSRSPIVSGAYGPFYIDEVKLYNGCLLPYGGGPMTGNGAVNTSVAHDEILFRWDCESTTVEIGDKTVTLGGGGQLTTGAALTGSKGFDTNGNNNNGAEISVVNADVFDPRKGSISFWLNFQTATTYDFIFGYGSTSNYIALEIGSSISYLSFKYHSNSTTENAYEASAGFSVGEWHYIKCTWDDQDIIQFFIDGDLKDTDTVANQWAGNFTDTLYIGASWSGGYTSPDCFIDQITITNNPNTPDRWSVFGKPVYMPMIKKNGIYQQYGADMNAVITGGSALITDLGEVS